MTSADYIRILGYIREAVGPKALPIFLAALVSSAWTNPQIARVFRLKCWRVRIWRDILAPVQDRHLVDEADRIAATSALSPITEKEGEQPCSAAS
jgi:hypothetical protein